jgi:16S rRNA (guanine966-N2)-methyltransferase
MRITGGSARGIPIGTGQAARVRPATDRMREAVFSSLGGRVGGARFLDLFAGSGSYGLEALSRGAAGGVFVETDARAVAALQRNLQAVMKSLGDPAGRRAEVVRRDALRFASAAPFDLVFMDPPHPLARGDAPALLEAARRLLGRDGVLVFELPADLEPPLAGWQCLRRLGKSGAGEPSALLLTADPAAPTGA